MLKYDGFDALFFFLGGGGGGAGFFPWRGITGWWFQIFVIFIPIWGNDPI